MGKRRANEESFGASEDLITADCVIISFQTLTNAVFHHAHSCAQILRAHFPVPVNQDSSCSQTRSRAKVKETISIKVSSEQFWR